MSAQSTSTTPNIGTMDFELDIFGQSPSLGIYTQLALLYPLNEGSSKQKVIDTLTSGLEKLVKAFPWTAGQVLADGAGPGTTGVFKIKRYKPSISLTIKDYCDDATVPSYADMGAAGFPFSMLDESRVASRNTIPGTFGEVFDAFPVFLVQASFVTGGLILTTVGHHQTMDAVGQAEIMELLSKACRGEAFTDDELRIGNMSRPDHIPLLDESAPAPVYEAPVAHPTTEASPSDSKAVSPPKIVWTYFSFSAAAQTALKNLANATKSASTAFVSTDDTLTAFTWRSVSRARSHRLPASTPCKSSRAVDIRPHFKLPPSYTGMFQTLVYSNSTLAAMSESPLGAIASQLRAVIDPATSTIPHDTRAHVTALTKAADKSTIAFATGFNLDVDLMLSSWTKVDVSGLDFGLGLGGPEVARRPQFAPFEGLGYLMPRGKNGEVVVGICLKEVDIKKMVEDEEMRKYAVHIP